MKSRWLKRLAWILPLVLILGFPIWRHYSAKRSVNACLKQLRAQGEKLAIGELTPAPPTDAVNGAAAFQSAAATVAHLGPDLMFSTARFVAPGKCRVTWQMAALPGETNAPDIWPDLKNYLDQYRGSLPALHTALDASWLDFKLDYNQGIMLRLPQFPMVRATQQFLCSMAILDFHQGNGEEARKSLRSAIRLAQLCGSEPLMISQMVDIAMIRIAWNAHWEALHYPGWKDADLADLQRIWGSLDILQNAETALSMERAMERVSLARLRADPAALRNFCFGPATAGTNAWSSAIAQVIPDDDPSLKAVVLRAFGPVLWRWWGSYDQELADLQLWQLGVDALRQIRLKKESRRSLQKLEKEVQTVDELGVQHQFRLPLAFGSSSTRFCKKAVAAEIRRQMMLSAIGLKRYHLRHGKYPAQLSDLVPDILPELPIDFVDGQPLRYRLKDDQHFLLYSVGFDGKDGGGDPSEGPAELNVDGKYTGRDWVYPEAATPEEIAADEASKRKRNRR